MKTWVKAGKHGWVDIEKTEFENIEESFAGDVYIFTYMGERYQSLIVHGSQPG